MADEKNETRLGAFTEILTKGKTGIGPQDGEWVEVPNPVWFLASAVSGFFGVGYLRSGKLLFAAPLLAMTAAGVYRLYTAWETSGAVMEALEARDEWRASLGFTPKPIGLVSEVKFGAQRPVSAMGAKTVAAASLSQ